MLQKYPQFLPPAKEAPVYISNCPPPYQYSKTSLNPDAKEWVPKEYRKECQDNQDKVKESLIPHSTQDFDEITEKEVQDVRTLTQSGTSVLPTVPCIDSSAISPAEKTCLPVTSKEGSLKSSPGVIEEVASPVESPSVREIKDPVEVCADASASMGGPQLDSTSQSSMPKTSNTQASIASQVSNTMKEDCVCAAVPQSKATVDSESLSYAGVVGRVSPPPPPPVDAAKLKYKGVEQPLPKIFQGDRSPSRQDDPRLPSDARTPELFKRPSKSQRNRSRRFLQELKESYQNRDICGSPSSLSDISATSDDLSTPPMSPQKASTLASSPQSRVPLISPQSGTHLPSPVQDMTSPIAIPIPVPSSSIGSPGNRTRTSSESSAASLDIEFVESDEVDRAVPDRVTPTKRSPGAGGRNGFLACILGSGESDTETDDDSDWDECESDTAPTLDDSWETFGFGLVVVECRMAPMAQTQCQKSEVAETHADEQCSDPALREVNRKWEAEIQRNVRGKSNQRVMFGKETVHPMVVWGHAYRQARKGPWEQQARDRARFAQRVASLEADLSLVLDPAHRRRVYRRLYAPPTRCFL